MLKKTAKYLVVLFIAMSVFSSCYEPVRACQDVLATNYSISADETCPDEVEVCCTYPDLFLTISQVVGDKSFNEDSIYTNVLEDSFKIVNAVLFLNDAQLTKADNSIVSVQEEKSIETWDGSGFVQMDVLDDVVLVTRPRINFSVGEFPFPGDYLRIQFNAGLNKAWSKVNTEALSSDHLLSTSDSLQMDVEEGFVFAQFDILRNYNVLDTTRLRVFGDQVPFSFDIDTTLNRGVDFSIPLKLDYEKWFEGVDFGNDDIDVIEQKLLDNVEFIFSLN